MTGGSLFTGIGGLDLALEACGVEVKWQVENNEYCNKVLERHWLDVKRKSDIRTTDFRELEHVDLVFGGFPCQPFSVAGKNKGEADERNMWPDTLRAIRESGCQYAFLENVPNLLTHQYFGTILADLASIGFNAEWDCFTASEVGAPHRRKRLFILAYSTSQRLSTGSHSEREHDIQENIVRDITQDIEHRDGRLNRTGKNVNDVAHTRCQHQHVQQRVHGAEHQGSGGELGDTSKEYGWGHPRTGCSEVSDRRTGTDVQWPPGPDDTAGWAYLLSEMPSLEPALCRVADGVPDRTHRLKALGNAVLPATGELAFRTLFGRIEIIT